MNIHLIFPARQHNTNVFLCTSCFNHPPSPALRPPSILPKAIRAFCHLKSPNCICQAGGQQNQRDQLIFPPPSCLFPNSCHFSPDRSQKKPNHLMQPMQLYPLFLCVQEICSSNSSRKIISCSTPTSDNQ